MVPMKLRVCGGGVVTLARNRVAVDAPAGGWQGSLPWTHHSLSTERRADQDRIRLLHISSWTISDGPAVLCEAVKTGTVCQREQTVRVCTELHSLRSSGQGRLRKRPLSPWPWPPPIASLRRRRST